MDNTGAIGSSINANTLTGNREVGAVKKDNDGDEQQEGKKAELLESANTATGRQIDPAIRVGLAVDVKA